jgi:hypothetical protein
MALDPIVGWTQIEQAQSAKEVQANLAMADLSQAGAGYLSKAITATATLSLDESQNAWIDLTGTPAGASDITLHASVNKKTLFRNLTTSGQTIRVRMSGGTFFPVPAQGTVVLLSSTQALTIHADTAPAALATTAVIGTSQELAREDHRHARDIVELAFNMETVTWTAQPAALTELFGLNDRRGFYDLTQFTQARLVANVEAAGFTGATLRAEFSTTDGGTYAALDNTTGPNVLIDATGTIVGSWATLTGAALAAVFLRISGVGGDGAANPQIGALRLQFR